MEYLPTLAEIITASSYIYEFVRTENKYRKAIKKRQNCIGFYLHYGYLSFNASYMCDMIAERLGMEHLSSTALGKELSYYHLAHTDSDNRQSCRWGTDKRYFHVNIRALLTLTYDWTDDEASKWLDYHFGKPEDQYDYFN